MVTFTVDDTTCGRCAQALAAALGRVPGNAEVVIDVGRKLVHIEGTAAPADLAAAIEQAGYRPQRANDALAQRRSQPPRRSCCCAGTRQVLDAGQPPTAASGSCCR